MECAGFAIKRLLVERLYGLRNLVSPPLDLADRVYRTLCRKRPYPPLSYRQRVSGRFWASVSDFEWVGRQWLEILQHIGGVKPNESILEIGCGCGRCARAILEWSDDSGQYVGCDVDKGMIEWCQATLAKRYANSSFFTMDVRSSFYNPEGAVAAKDYHFPLEDQSFDLIFLASVFTHMLVNDTANYLSEIRRLLAPDGRAVLSMHILSEDRLDTDAVQSTVTSKFPYRRDRYAVASEKYPELDVGFEEDLFRDLLSKSGLKLDEPVHWGTWRGSTDGISDHDIVLVKQATHSDWRDPRDRR